MIQAKAILRDAERILLAKHQVSLDEATAPMLSDALGEAAMLAIGPEWTKTTRAFQKTRQAHYLSAEYLIGRMVYANFYNLGILDDVRALLSRKGVDMAVLEDIEDAALGNGGLGRLAACFLDSAASLDLPLTGYGLRYRYGLFKQVLEDGMQKEIPDDWTRFGDPWSVRREELAVVVPMATGDVRAVPYDMPVIGYHTDTIGTLRLWQTESLHEFDFALFNDYKYAEACADKNRAEDITKCLYPNDWNIEGKRLRLKQQYVLSSASLQDILRQYEARHGKNYRMLPREHALQLNDTHPVLAIPELIRLLTARGVSFACAARYAREMFGYTNHTVMPEALEKWELTLVASVAPEIERILRRLGIFGQILLLLFLIAWVCWVVWLQRYVVYTNEGVKLDFSQSSYDISGVEAAAPSDDVKISIFYNEGADAIDTAKEMTQLAGYYITNDMCKEDMDNVMLQIERLPSKTPVMVEMKGPFGSFFYNSKLSGAVISQSTDIPAMEKLVARMNTKGFYKIARISSLRDRSFGEANVTSGLYMLSRAGLWMDTGGMYWLDPTSASTITWISSVVLELKEMGFDEVLLDSCGWPGGGDGAAVNGDPARDLERRTETVDKFLAETVQALEPYDAALAIRCSAATAAGQDGLTGLTPALLEQYADRLWIDGSTAGLGAGSVAVVTRLSESRTEPQAILP